MEGSQPFIYRCAPRGTRTGHCSAGIVKNIISNVFKKNAKAGHGPVPCPDPKSVLPMPEVAPMIIMVCCFILSCSFFSEIAIVT